MNIIEHGNTYKKITCPECNCIFNYYKKDIKEIYLYDPLIECNCILYKYIHCPECYEQISVKDYQGDD